MAHDPIQIHSRYSNGNCMESNAEECDSQQLNGGMTSSRLAFNTLTIALPSSCHISPRIFFTVDAGGTLAKLVYVERSSSTQVGSCKRSTYNGDARGYDDKDDVTIRLKLATFDADNIDSLLDFANDFILPRCGQGQTRSLPGHFLSAVQDSCSCSMSSTTRSTGVTTAGVVRATGVGCVLHHEHITSKLKGIDFQFDGREMDHCVAGIGFLWRHLAAEELLHADLSDIEGLTFQTHLTSSGALPCLVVNMGSALTIVQVNEDGRVAGIVGGSSQGGMTFLGLGRLLTKATSFEELMELASRGRCQEVDLTVKDVAGTEYNSTASDVIVSSFGKVAKRRALDPEAAFNEEDLAASLLYCIVEEMIKTVYLVAKAQNVHSAIFCGSFFANDKSMMNHIRRKIRICATYLRHQLSALFVRHQGYLGAIGLLAAD